MEELFAPPAYEWQRLSPKYRSMRLLTSLIFVPILFTIPAIIVGVASGKWWISGVIWAVAAHGGNREFEQLARVRDELVEPVLAHRGVVVQVAEHPRVHHPLAFQASTSPVFRPA
mgnify:CR=1 FL=1